MYLRIYLYFFLCMLDAFSSWEKCSLQKLPVCKKKIGLKWLLWWEQCLREMQLGLEVNWILYKLWFRVCFNDIVCKRVHYCCNFVLIMVFAIKNKCTLMNIIRECFVSFLKYWKTFLIEKLLYYGVHCKIKSSSRKLKYKTTW